MERRGGQAGSSLSFWKPGRLKWGPACLSLCSCALFFPSLAPFPIALVPLQIIAGDCAQVLSDPKHLIGI